MFEDDDFKFEMNGDADRSSTPATPLIIRCDAGAAIGNGHIMRCLALAQAWRRHGATMFAFNQIGPEITERLQTEGFATSRITSEIGSIEDARETIAAARIRQASLVCLDGYQFGSDYQSEIKQAGHRLLVIDDVSSVSQYHADWILNQNLYARSEHYTGKAGDAQLMLGPRYALLRSEFTGVPPVRIPERRPLRLLITLGGTDPKNVTLKVLSALEKLGRSDLLVRIVVGPGNQQRGQIVDFARRLKCETQVECNVQNMRSLLEWADLAITAGGSTCYEMFFMHVPMMVIETAWNQSKLVQAIADTNAGIVLGTVEQLEIEQIVAALEKLLTDCALRCRLIEAGRVLVDGRGAERVAKLLARPQITLRDCKSDDCEQLWQLRNDPVVRQMSFSSEPIPLETHMEWFRRKLAGHDTRILILEDEQGRFLGQVRFDGLPSTVEISLALTAAARGKGLSAVAIQQAVRFLEKHGIRPSISAYVKDHNVASRRAFECAGFRLVGSISRNSEVAQQFIFQYAPAAQTS